MQPTRERSLQTLSGGAGHGSRRADVGPCIVESSLDRGQDEAQTPPTPNRGLHETGNGNPRGDNVGGG